MSYRPGDVAKRLGIAPVTLRVWSNEFAGFLSEGAQRSVNDDGKAAQRRYTDSDIATLQRAQQLLASGRTYDEARQELIAAEPIPPASLTAMAEAVAFLAEIRQTYDRVVEAKNMTIQEQREHIDTLKGLLERQQAEIDQLRATSRPPWWRRLFGG